MAAAGLEADASRAERLDLWRSAAAAVWSAVDRDGAVVRDRIAAIATSLSDSSSKQEAKIDNGSHMSNMLATMVGLMVHQANQAFRCFDRSPIGKY